MYSHLFLRLYSNVFEQDSITYSLTEQDLTKAIQHIHETYHADPENLQKKITWVADYNKAACRCAYMYKYAAFHTSLVYEAMSLAIAENPQVLSSVLDSLVGPFQICSLGGGPGTDIVGVLAAMQDRFGVFPCHAKLVDLMEQWKETFQSVVTELRLKTDPYGTLSESVSWERFAWSFQAADLKQEFDKKLEAVIRNSDLITMIKFVSATACQDTSKMIERIFDAIKPGALVLFVDNAAGGFQEMVSDAAEKYHLKPAFGSLTHKLFFNKAFYNNKFGYESCYKTRVAVQLLLKVDVTKNSKEIPFSKELPSLRNVKFSPLSTSSPRNQRQPRNVLLPQGQIANSRFNRDSLCDGPSSNQALPSRFHGPVRSSRVPRPRRAKLYHRPRSPLQPFPSPHPGSPLLPGRPSPTYQANAAYVHGGSVKYASGEDSLNYGSCDNSVNYGSCNDSRYYGSYEGSGFHRRFQNSGNYRNCDDSGFFGSFQNSLNDGNCENSFNDGNRENSVNFGNCENYFNYGNCENSVNFGNRENYGNYENSINFENRENLGNYDSYENSVNFGNCENSVNFGNRENYGNYENSLNYRSFENSVNFGNAEDSVVYSSFENSVNYGNGGDSGFYSTGEDSVNYGSNENSRIYDCGNSQIFENYEKAQIYDNLQTYEPYNNSQSCGPYKVPQTNRSYKGRLTKKAFKRPLLNVPLVKTHHFR